MQNRSKFHISGKPVTDGRGGGTGSWISFFASLLTFSFGLTCVYHAMRGVLRLGGFVAYGGPYHIAHEAPDWVWIFPVSIFLILISMFMSLATTSRKIGGPNLMSLSWSAIFLALGWNFVEFGFGIGRGGGIMWGWAICAVAFMLMGLIPMVFILRSFGRALRERQAGTDQSYPGSPASEGLSWGVSILAQIIVAAGGVALGMVFFSVIS